MQQGDAYSPATWTQLSTAAASALPHCMFEYPDTDSGLAPGTLCRCGAEAAGACVECSAALCDRHSTIDNFERVCNRHMPLRRLRNHQHHEELKAATDAANETARRRRAKDAEVAYEMLRTNHGDRVSQTVIDMLVLRAATGDTEGHLYPDPHLVDGDVTDWFLEQTAANRDVIATAWMNRRDTTVNADGTSAVSIVEVQGWRFRATPKEVQPLHSRNSTTFISVAGDRVDGVGWDNGMLLDRNHIADLSRSTVSGHTLTEMAKLLGWELPQYAGDPAADRRPR